MLFLFLLFFGIPEIHATILLPQMSNPLAAFSCQLRVVNSSDSNSDYPLCSGTYISAQLFLTAAHCIDNDLIIGKLENFKKQLYVTCPGGRSATVKRTFIHPDYFPKYFTNSKGYLDPITNGNVGDSVNDMALLLTDSIAGISSYPEISYLKDGDQPTELSQCSGLGFTPLRNLCNFITGEGCYRSGFNMVPPSEKSKGYLSTDDITNSQFEKGDSGTGVFCTVDRNKQYLTSLWTNGRTWAAAVPLFHQKSFIEQFKYKSPTELMSENIGVNLAPSALIVMQKIYAINLSIAVLKRKIEISCSGRYSKCLSGVNTLEIFFSNPINVEKSALKRFLTIAARVKEGTFIIESGELWINPKITQNELELLNRLQLPKFIDKKQVCSFTNVANGQVSCKEYDESKMSSKEDFVSDT